MSDDLSGHNYFGYGVALDTASGAAIIGSAREEMDGVKTRGALMPYVVSSSCGNSNGGYAVLVGLAVAGTVVVGTAGAAGGVLFYKRRSAKPYKAYAGGKGRGLASSSRVNVLQKSKSGYM